MNVNQREMGDHVEFEPTTYYAAFSAELEASAYPMWALVSHLRGPESAGISRRALNFCLTALQDWLDAIHFTNPDVVSRKNFSKFHKIIETSKKYEKSPLIARKNFTACNNA